MVEQKGGDVAEGGDSVAMGAEIGGYRVDSLLGRGGMGVVYRAHDLALDRSVALKVLAPELAEDARFRDRFLRESRQAASIDHPAIVPIYDAGEADGRLYIAMRLVDGTDLKRLLAAGGKLPPERALALLGQIADALDVAHERGLVHRDVKPSNILVDSRDHCYLADFGLSRRLADPPSGGDQGRSLGTVDYVAPEQIHGHELDGRADVYSLGCVLYESLAGRPPFSGTSETAVVFAHLEDEPPSLPRLEEVFGKALAKEPGDRYASGGELIRAARSALGLVQQRRARWPAVAAALVAAVGISSLAVFLTRGTGVTQSESGADMLVRIDPRSSEVTRSTAVGRAASGVAAAGSYVWVTSAADGTVWRIDARTNARSTIPAQGTPTAVAAGNSGVMVADAPEGILLSINPEEAAASFVTRVRVDAGGNVPVAAGKHIWFADAAERLVGQVDLSAVGGGARSTAIPVAPDTSSFLSQYETFDGLAVGEGAIWTVGDTFGRTLWKLDPAVGQVVDSVSVPFVPGSIAAGEGGVWIASLLDDRIARIDPVADRITAIIHVGGGIDGIAAGDGGVWVISSSARSVTRIDPRTDSVARRVRLPRVPTHVAVGAGAVWVTTTAPPPSARADSIRIGVLGDCTGPFGSWYERSVAGAELALLRRGASRAGPNILDGVKNAGVAGKPVALALGCTDGTATSLLVEARRLVEEVGVQILIAATGGREGLALEQFARRHPRITFVSALAGTQELDPPRNVFSFNPDGAEWMAGLGSYAYRTLGWRRAVVVGDEAQGVFNWAQLAGFVGEFCSLGGSIVKRVWIPPATSDYSGLVSGLPRTGVDGIVAATSTPAVLAMARGYRLLRTDVARRLILGANTTGPGLAQLGAGSANLLFSGYWEMTPGAAGKRYQAAVKAHFPSLVTGIIWDIAYHNAMAATLQALAAVHADLSHGERRFMTALGAVHLESPTGVIRLDSSRQAITVNYLARLDGRLYRRIGGVEPSFGGYFTAHDAPPGRTTPACKRRSPPAWAR